MSANIILSETGYYRSACVECQRRKQKVSFPSAIRLTPALPADYPNRFRPSPDTIARLPLDFNGFLDANAEPSHGKIPLGARSWLTLVPAVQS